jgi:O-antigen/teichoic acid export membrane protein
MYAHIWRRLKAQFQERATAQTAQNVAWLLGERVFRFFANVMVGFWVARYLGPERFGTLAYVLSLVAMFSWFAEMGLEAIVRREILRGHTDPTELLANSSIIRFVAGLLACAVSGVFIAHFEPQPEVQRLFGILMITLLQPALSTPELYFYAKLQARRIVIAQIVGISVGAVMKIGAIAAALPLSTFAWIVLAEMTTSCAMILYFGRKEGLRLSMRRFNPAICRALLSRSWPLVFSSLAVVIYMRVDVVMLRWLADERDVGMFSAAARLAEMFYFLPGILATSLLPSLLAARDGGAKLYRERLQQYYDLTVMVAYVIAIPVVCLSQVLVEIAYGAAYAEAANVLIVQAWACVFVFMGVARSQALLNDGQEKILLVCTCLGLLTNLLLNLILIPRYTAVGAAIATVASQFVSAWGSSWLFKNTRLTAKMQTRALLIPFRLRTYLAKPSNQPI